MTCVLALMLSTPAVWAQTFPRDPNTPPVLTPDDYPPVSDSQPSQTAKQKHDEDLPPVADAPDNSAPAASPSAPDQNTAATDATAPPQALPGATTDQVSPLPPVQQAVEVGTLGSAEGPPVGTLDSTNGGLGSDIWSGTERAKAEDLLSRVTLVSADPTIRNLAKRIVLTKAASPLGSAKRAFVTIRIEKLLDAGLIDDAGTIASQASVTNDEDFARVQAEALLVDNRASDVCSNLTVTRLTAGEPFWLQLRAYCAAVGGDQPTADLTRSVLQAQGHTDKAYDILVDDVLNHKTTPPGPIAHPTAMHVFLLQQAGLPITGDIAAAMGTPENLLAMRDARNTPLVRFAAAERIVRTGAVPVAELKVIADGLDIPLSRIANAAFDAQTAPFFSAQTILRRAALIEPRPEAKAQLVNEALTLGDKAGLLPLAAALQVDNLMALKPSPTTQAMAPMFARALLLAGRANAAARWMGDKDSPAAQILLDLAAPNPERDVKARGAMSLVAARLMQNPPVADSYKPYEALLLGIADTLGRPMPPDAKAQAPAIEAQHWDGQRPDPGIMRNIEAASLRPDRHGEALLTILDTVHSIGLRDLAPDVTIEFVRLIGSMGLQNSAQDFAMDALMQYVPPPPPPPGPTAAQ